MIFPAPRRWYLHPFRCFWVAVWNTIETYPVPMPKRLPPWLFGKALGSPGRRVN